MTLFTPNNNSSFKADLQKGFDGFETGFSENNGVSIAYRVGGKGSAVLLLHGWPMTGFEWSRVASDLVKEHRVIIPDYRGAGSSSVPNKGYDSLSLATDLVFLLDRLELDAVHLVGHDIGMQIATALAIAFPERLKSLTVIESVIPGMSAYQDFVASGEAWHFKFNSNVELATDLTEGCQGRYFQRFYEDFTAKPDAISQEDRDYYADCFGTRDRLMAGYRIYEAFDESATFFSENLQKSGLSVPTLAICGAASIADSLDATGKDFGTQQTKIIENSGHFIPEENPKALIREFWSLL